ncbi:hypothetical protein R1sor_009170 [Riccia sorocarpa]|uniref:Uncharacterized protein n=1 Tax=Riccia sorocarpa TaxID=122646 RepID=A0ABD3H6Z4_9MARC
MSLGSLLRYAGREWRGGELRLRGLCSLKAISRLYRDQGMPTVERWRFCLGEGDTAHAPLTYGTSKQDDYTKSGLKCSCAHRPSTGLQRDCEICTERCAVTSCRLQRKNMESFDYIPIGSMLKLICRSRTYCHSMLSMWRAKHRWFMPDEMAVNVVPTFPIKEWWDGTKEKDISWFWDSGKTWELPVVCAACQEVYQAFPAKCQMLITNFNVNTKTYNFICESCGTRVISEAKFTQGYPRNIPLLAHWDGFQSVSTVFRSTWTVETKVLSAGSASPLPPMPVLFIPNTKGDPSNKSEALNACLRPLMAELINLFVNGVDVVYNYPSELIDNRDLPRRFKLRAMLILFTGDHPAQCKFSGFASSGYSACRRCKMNASLHVQHGPNSRPGGVVVYDCNRRQYRHLPVRKTVTELRQAVLELNACTTSAAQKEVSQRTGVVADSNVWKLYDLYGFNPSLDLTYDAMHVLALSMFKKYTELLKKDSERTSAGRDALIAGLVEATKKKPRSFRGRGPKDPFNRLGYFKAEEYSNFVLYCVPHILYEGGYKPGSVLYDLGRLVVEIARHEEGVGPTGSILDHVAGAGELLDDVRRHGPSHVYRCYSFERLVSSYNKIKTNSRHMETTFTSHYVRTFFSVCCEAMWADDDGLLPPQRIKLRVDENTVYLEDGRKSSVAREHTSPARGIIYVSSQRSAKLLMAGLMSELLESTATDSSSSFLSVSNGIGEVPTRVTLLKSTMVKATLYGPGDYAFVKSDSSDRREGSWHWKTKISRIFAHSCRGYIQIFFEGTWFFNSITKSGGRDFCRFDPISDMELLDQHARVALGDNCRPVHLLECHFFPVQQKKHRDNHILAIPTGPYTRHSTMFGEGGVGHPPPQPEVDDVMLAAHRPNCSTKFLEHCVVTEVQNTAAVLDKGDEDATERMETSIIVKVLWLRRTVPGQWEINGGRRCCCTMQVAQLRQRVDGFTRLSGNTAWTYNLG